MQEVFRRLGPLTYGAFTVHDEFVYGIAGGIRQIDRACPFTREHAALGGALEREFHELQRLQCQTEFREGDDLRVFAVGGCDEVQPQLRIGRISILRAGPTRKLGDGQKAHFQ